MQGGAPFIAQAIMTSLTAGTFLYIAMTEIVSHEFASDQNKSLKMFGFLFGLVSFAIFLCFEPEHGH